MRKFIRPLALSISLLFTVGAHAETPSYIGQHVSTPEDTAAITKITEDFRAAISNKDAKLLSTLVLNSNILFSSASSPELIKTINDKYDVNYDGLSSGGFTEFSQYLAKEKNPIEEKFYNIKITQDGHTAWVNFDYEFVADHKTENYGIETWQLIKAANGSWKIISVVWSAHPVPKAATGTEKN